MIFTSVDKKETFCFVGFVTLTSIHRRCHRVCYPLCTLVTIFLIQCITPGAIYISVVHGDLEKNMN